MADDISLPSTVLPAGARPAPLIDPFQRAITYLRISVTDRCDLRCAYCMSENMQFLPKRDLLSLEELDRLCGVFIARGVRKLRITGASPWCAATSCTCSGGSRAISTQARSRS